MFLNTYQREGSYEKVDCNLDHVWGLCDWTIDGPASRPSCRHVQGQSRRDTFWPQQKLQELCMSGVIEGCQKGRCEINEDWVKDDHAIMLPAQFIKELGAKISDFELSLIGTDPLYASNAAKSPKEKEMLAELAGGSKKVVITGEDGGKTIGMSADFAKIQLCADCHNKHPKTTKKDWKKGDFMGAIVVRMK